MKEMMKRIANAIAKNWIEGHALMNKTTSVLL
jgi:hypothetical protein